MKQAMWMTAGLAVLTGFGPLAAQSPTDRLKRVLSDSAFSGSVIVTRDGATVFAAGYGMADRGRQLPNTPETIFRIGSVTKQFTAMAILILQDRGLLDVRDSVGRYVPGLPASWQGLTIHQLLTHTSGLMHSWALPGFTETMARPTTLDETLARFYDQPPLFQPGTDFAYSGLGYFLLAKLIERVSGQDYGTFLRTEIFEPLGMRNTGADHPGLPASGRALGYVRGDDGTISDAPEIFVPVLTGGGNLYSTIGDLATWDRALAGHQLVSERAYEAMYRPERQSYAYGWQIAQLQGHQVLQHSGGLPGFNAFNLRLPSDDIDVVVLSNVAPTPVGKIARELAAAMLNAAP
jgi:CubicO group peptidase (beta-lactamase class C family)